MNMKRAGEYIRQPTGYRAFIPGSLPPEPPLKYDESRNLLSEADRALARLDGITTVLPNPELFVGMYVKKEALLSSQIEGTQASLEGVLKFEADLTPSEDINEIKEVINYIKALDYGIKRLKNLPLSNRLIKEIHKILISGTRGSHKTPGEFRKTQNWIGPAGANLDEATFVPPPPDRVSELMSELEKFIHRKDDIPPLIKIALIHSQFETIHPFLDGNGRIGRLLITFYLYWRGILSHPLLYLSFYLKRHREKYYNWLMKVRLNGDWEGWINFFLKGVTEVSDEASLSAREIIKLKEYLIRTLIERKIGSGYAVGLIELIFSTPIVTSTEIQSKLGIKSKDTVNSLLKRFVELNILQEVSGKKRYKKYMFSKYIEIIKKGTEI
ncbi:Fic family protein [Candidatus Aerophobetes bacterium]|uniref:Fic family protein n=1 Tax=Aerophobetes bacterium TaxID=2030807 RepID=A0A662D4H9_UNCAE|nr:MAG: Fic family protein [Candidatus Aerophobetes bacterium]